ncbi:MAG TPA: AlkA N-terminal domain-containing protein [Candidatus Polarisedimenticolia bacterium]|nr:AlkA N-terminal domain-containing protein [Candidatus Polarisedimenticolia bacterium]
MSAGLSLDIRALDRARDSRDPRFDGKFFIAVTSTHIYCRPICTVRNAKRANIRYYFSAAAAAEAGYRPCLRCRPEAAPGTAAWLGTSAVVRRALRLIDAGILDDGSVDQLAGKLGVGARHLDRLFVQHVGASPIALAQTRRLHFAKRLLDETNLPIGDIALAAGFGSLRRFNSAFRRTYKCAPRDLRRRRRGDPVAHPAGTVILKLAFRPPYEFARVLAFLRARAIPGVEEVDEASYSRTVRTGNGEAIVSVGLVEGELALELRVTGADPTDLYELSSAARRVFDTSADPAQMVQAFGSDPVLGPLVTRFPGLRIPGAWDPFECAVRAIMGQQVSVAGARTLATRLVERLGARLKGPAGGLTTLFPSPRAIVEGDLQGLGLTRGRMAALRSLAQSVVARKLEFAGPTDETVAALNRISGVGDWTSQYIALRALGDPDAFPTSDLVLRRMAGGETALSEGELQSRAEAWRPWRAYAATYLWDAAARSNGSPSKDEAAVKAVRARSTEAAGSSGGSGPVRTSCSRA